MSFLLFCVCARARVCVCVCVRSCMRASVCVHCTLQITSFSQLEFIEYLNKHCVYSHLIQLFTVTVVHVREPFIPGGGGVGQTAARWVGGGGIDV